MLIVYIIFNFNCTLETVIKTQETLSWKAHNSLLPRNKVGPEGEEDRAVEEDGPQNAFLS